MATIAIRRPFLSEFFHAPGTLRFRLPHLGSGTLGNPGDHLKSESATTGGRVSVDNTGGTLGAGSGVLERKLSANPSAGTLVPVTLLVPNHFWEATAKDVATDPVDATAFGFTDAAIADSGNSQGYIIDFGNAGGVDAVITCGFVSWMDREEVNRIITQSGTTETAGRNVEPGVSKGISGDIQARMLHTWSPAHCMLSQ